jgi:hypothetical protein
MGKVPPSAQLPLTTRRLRSEIGLNLNGCGLGLSWSVDDKIDAGVRGQASTIDAELQQAVLHQELASRPDVLSSHLLRLGDGAMRLSRCDTCVLPPPAGARAATGSADAAASLVWRLTPSESEQHRSVPGAPPTVLWNGAYRGC